MNEKLIEKFEKVYYETFIAEQFPYLVEAIEYADMTEDEIYIFIDGVISTLCLLFDRSTEQIINDIRLELSLKDAL